MHNFNSSVLFLAVMPTWGWIVMIAIAVVALLIGALVGVSIWKSNIAKKVGSANEQGRKIVSAAEAEAERIKAQGKEESKSVLIEALLEVYEQYLKL